VWRSLLRVNRSGSAEGDASLFVLTLLVYKDGLIGT
jgi:hypothetical protein